MKNYKIFKHSDGMIEAVKQGWSWPAFFFGFIWALVKRLWSVAGILIVISIVVNVISISLEPHYTGSYYEYEQAEQTYLIWSFCTLIISIFILCYLGAKGNTLRESNLLKRDYQFIGTAVATNPDMAIHQIQTNDSQKNNNTFSDISL